MKAFYIGFFGLLGVFSRYYVGIWVAKIVPGPFPLGIFIINITGAFLIGLIYVLGVERSVISADVRIGIMVGFLGGFTTFSSYCLEINRLVEEAELLYAGLYFGLSSLLGILGSAFGMFIARRVGGVL